jgi:hypothetical protein
MVKARLLDRAAAVYTRLSREIDFQLNGDSAMKFASPIAGETLGKELP